MPSIETIVRSISDDPEEVLFLLEYSFGNMFDYEVQEAVKDGLNREQAIDTVLRRAWRERNIHRV